jgi:hypothetical protein
LSVIQNGLEQAKPKYSFEASEWTVVVGQAVAEVRL